MEQRKTRWERGLLAVLARVALITSFLFLAYSPKPVARSFFALQKVDGGSDSPGAVTRLNGNLVFYRGSSNKAPVYLLADVAVDEDFVYQVGNGWEATVHEMMEDANTLLDGVGLYIEVASIQYWRSEDTEKSILVHLDSAERQTQRVPGRLFLAITGNDTIKFDGWAQESRSRMIVRYHHEDEERNAPLIAHEVGHLMGAEHHESEDGCPENGCIMNQRGYASGRTWCKYHKQVIGEYIASRLGSQSVHLAATLIH